MVIAIAGATGNLGRLLSHYLAQNHRLILLTHKRAVQDELSALANVQTRGVDLANEQTLRGCLDGAECVISMAGVLFRGSPEKFLPITNTKYVENLAAEAARAGVRKFILVSFPHVEGETSPDAPARGVIPGTDPNPIHARTRLAAERALVQISNPSLMTYLIVRAGVIYGREVKLIEAARKYMRRRMLLIWPKPTWIHLLALPDFLAIMKQCVEDPNITGILNVADDQPILLRDFLNRLAGYWKYPEPFVVPELLFKAAAHAFDWTSRIFHCAVPLNPDILAMGVMSTVCDTSRLKNELGYRLQFPTLEQGLSLI